MDTRKRWVDSVGSYLVKAITEVYSVQIKKNLSMSGRDCCFCVDEQGLGHDVGLVWTR